jgi:hypothetical protein
VRGIGFHAERCKFKQAVFVDTAYERLSSHAQVTRSHRLIPVALLQCPKQYFLFEAAKTDSIRMKIEIDGFDLQMA